MQISIEYVDNPNQEYWLWDQKITNKQGGRIYPSTISNVGSGKSVAVYQIDNQNIKHQIAQLICPDYEKLSQYYLKGKDISLDYTYIDNFTWLGNKKPYEVENLPYTEREGFTARCSFWNNSGNPEYLHIMQAKILSGYIDFSYAGFYDLNLDFVNLSIECGNLWFKNARFHNTQISLGTIKCSGDQLFQPEVSFSGIIAENSKIDAMIMSQKLSIDFICAKTTHTTITLDPLPTAIQELCLSRATIEKITVTNAEIDSLWITEADIDFLEFKRCKFLGLSQINGDIRTLHINDCINSNVFKISSPQINKISFANTINNGKFCFSDFKTSIAASLKANVLKDSSGDANQLLMLKENFRQIGEYQNEDICHLLYQKLKTKQERNILKKFGRYLLDSISGYGTKPFRMLLAILVLIVLFGSIYYFIPLFAYHGANTWIEHIYVSGITFFAVGYGDLFPLNTITKMVSLGEAFLGVSATSYFLVLLSRKVIR